MVIPPNQQFEVYVRLRTSAGVDQTNVVYTEPVVSFLKQGGVAPVAKVLAVSDWRQLSSTSMPGVYGLTFSAAELDTPGQFLYYVQSIGAQSYVGLLTVDQYAGDVYTRLGAPAGASVSADIAAVAGSAVSKSDLTTTRIAKLDKLDDTVTSRAAASTAVSSVDLTPSRIAKLDNLDATVSSRTSGPYVSFIGAGETLNPVIVTVTAPNRNQVKVTFSEPVVMTTALNGALNPANYVIQGVTVTSVVKLADNQVLLGTTSQTSGASYTLRVTNVEDLNGNPVI